MNHPAIRLREDLCVVTEDGSELTLHTRLGGAQRTCIFTARLWADGGRDTGESPEFTFAAKRLARDWLIVVTNRGARGALDDYRKRWSIECMVAHAKTRGLNIEDTRLTCARTLDLLKGFVTLDLDWAERVAVNHFYPRAPARKAHGHLAQSWFRLGFERLRSLLRTNPHQACAAWRRLQPKTPKNTGVVWYDQSMKKSIFYNDFSARMMCVRAHIRSLSPLVSPRLPDRSVTLHGLAHQSSAWP